MKNYVRNNTIEVVSMGDEIGMLNVSNGKYYILDSIGKEVWGVLEQSKTVSDIVDYLLTIYSVEREKCFDQISLLIEELINKGIVLEA